MEESLLEILRNNAKESPETMAMMLGVPVGEVEAAIARLEREGVIRGWQAIVNEDLAPRAHVNAVIEVRVTPEREGGFNRIAGCSSCGGRACCRWRVS